MILATWTLAVRKVFRALPLSWLIRLLSLNRWRVVGVREEIECAPSVAVVEKASPLVQAWWRDDGLQNLASAGGAQLSYRSFSDVQVSANRRGGFLFDGSSLLVPHTGLAQPAKVFFPNTAIAGILDQVGSTALLRKPRGIETIDCGIFTGSMAPHNWFHWVIDNLPNLFAAQLLPDTFRDYPLLVPEIVFERPSWREPLEMVIQERTLLPVPGDQWLKVKSLIRLDGVTRPNPRSLAESREARIAIVKEPFLSYRDFIVAQLGLEKHGVVKGRKLFLARKPSEVRRYNQEEIIELSRKLGFEPVYLDDLSFFESVKLFREAEAIIGPHGAAWANLIFANPEAKAMLWTWAGEPEDNWYENVAYLSNVRYRQIFYPSSTLASGLRVDPRVADYHLDPEHFLDSVVSLESVAYKAQGH